MDTVALTLAPSTGSGAGVHSAVASNTAPALRALGKASLGPFLYIYISPHIIISTHCYPQEIATLTLYYTRI